MLGEVVLGDLEGEGGIHHLLNASARVAHQVFRLVTVFAFLRACNVAVHDPNVMHEVKFTKRGHDAVDARRIDSVPHRSQFVKNLLDRECSIAGGKHSHHAHPREGHSESMLFHACKRAVFVLGDELRPITIHASILTLETCLPPPKDRI